MIGKIIIGIILIVIGFIITYKSEWLLNNFGRIAFFDKHLGTEGGSRLGYKLVGIIIIVIGIMVATNFFSAFMHWILSPLTRNQLPVQ